MKLSQAKAYLPFVQAAAEGKTIQFRTKNTQQWTDWDDARHVGLFRDDESVGAEYRIKPEPKLRPWKPEEVPVGALIQTKSCEGGFPRHMIVAVSGIGDIKAGVCFSGCTKWALEHCQHSTDGGKTWHPCGVQE